MPRSTPSAMRTVITSSWSGRPAANGSHPARVAGAETRIAPASSISPVVPGSSARRSNWPPAGTGPVARPMPGVLLDGRTNDPLAVFPDDRPELAVAIPGPREPWGVLHVVGETAGSLGPRDLDVARVAADALGAIVSGAQRADEVAHLLHRAEALRRVATDIGSRLDLDRILSGLVDHAMVLFEGDRAAVFLQHPDGHVDGRGQPRPVGGVSSPASATSRSGRCRPPRWRRSSRCSRSTTATTRAARTSGRPSSRRASTRCARRR